MARTLLLEIVLAEVEQGVEPNPPVLNSKWLTLWRKTWSVSLRKPTKRFKVKRSVAKHRAKVYWCNLFAIRHFFKRTKGYVRTYVFF